MHYFSLHTGSDEHLGFFVMTADNEHEQPPQSGRFLVKLQSETPPPTAAAQALAPSATAKTPASGSWQATVSISPPPTAAPPAASATNTSPSAAKPSC